MRRADAKQQELVCKVSVEERARRAALEKQVEELKKSGPYYAY